MIVALGGDGPSQRPNHIMTKPSLRILFFAALMAAAVPGQDANQEQLKAHRAEKEAKEVFTLAKWTFDFDLARERARKSGRRIFAYFTRSYAH